MRRTVSSLTTISVLGLVALSTGDASAIIVGPNTFGYRAVDQSDGAVYQYVDISGGVAFLVNQDDAISMPQMLGAPFPYFGVPVAAFRASSNGFLTVTGDSASFTNSCGPINAGGGGEHIAPLHDDLVTSVYYQYFDQAAAAGVGYPGETAGISVFQWEGRYFNAGGPSVDFETILFHDDGTILNLVALATQGGSSSTSGIHSGAGNHELLYSCNTVNSIVGGVTAVRYSPPPDVSINEVRVDQPSDDNDEYIELVGPPGASLDGLSYVVLGDGAGASGTIESILSLNGQVIPADGYFVVAEGTFTLGPADLTVMVASQLNFENTDTTTHLLLRSFTGALNADLDAGNDGTLETTPWFAVEDAVSLIDNGDADLPYAPGAVCTAGPSCNSLDVAAIDVGHAFRCGDFDGTWNEGTFSVAAVPNSDSPGEPNPCACGDGLLIVGEVCDAGGEAVMCDDDCTLPVCGDGNPNMLAGEVCDDGGESAVCNADCTAAICGDGVTNMTAGETCDDEGESVMCDDDCSAPSCGDGNANMAAGEECDDGGESATCNADCTPATCGDEIVNATAGETCDDGGRSATCNANCTTASCGDGIFNMTAGEECDGDGNGNPGPTATCDMDCTNAMCGDMVVNDAAGETCDAGAEAADCDDDCTAPSCGDDNLNEAAGEECDDGNTDDGDGCSATCTEEEEPGTSSGEESSSGGEESSTGGEDSSTTDDPSGTSGDTSATDPDSSGTDPDTSGSASATDSDTSDEDGDTEGDESSSGGTGAAAGDDGCGCNTTDERDLTASLLAFFGLGALRRRRRRA